MPCKPFVTSFVPRPRVKRPYTPSVSSTCFTAVSMFICSFDVCTFVLMTRMLLDVQSLTKLEHQPMKAARYNLPASSAGFLIFSSR